MGKTHIRLGACYYILFSIIPVLAAVPMLGNTHAMTIPCILTVMMASTLPDADTQHSTISRLNPATGIPIGIIDAISRMILYLIRIVLTLGLCVLTIYYSKTVISEIHKIKMLAPYAAKITYGFAALMFLLALTHEKVIRHIPILGHVYIGLKEVIDTIADYIKRVLLIIIYCGLGVGIAWHNFHHGHDIIIYLSSILFIGIGIFPHRTFLHSIEGITIFTIVFSYVANKYGYGYLTKPFFIGYFSHLYLSDTLTNSGVPLTIIPFILKKVGLDQKLQEYRVYKIINRILSFKIRISLMQTGTNFGNTFEALYILSLVIAIFITVTKFHVL